jgi:uncharacterized repeat protein (TIGR03803 family)
MLAGCAAAGPTGLDSTHSAVRDVASHSNTTAALRVLYSFAGGADGSTPAGGLVSLGGLLYGMTEEGGANASCIAGGCGAVYSVDPGTGAEHIVYSFLEGNDGSFPIGNLVAVNGVLYGATSRGGGTGCNSNGCGTIVSVTPSGQESVIYRFTGGSDGAEPVTLITDGTTLYGQTSTGGSQKCPYGGCGTVFSLSTTGVFKTVHAFSGIPGDDYSGTALVYANHTLYASSNVLIISGEGASILAISPTGSTKVLYSFLGGSFGGAPLSLQYDKGSLLGTTDLGGTKGCSRYGSTWGCGLIFDVNAKGVQHPLHTFKGADGAAPVGSVMHGGVLYGAASGGGGNRCAGHEECGLIFSVTSGGTERTVYAFQNPEQGWWPQAAPIFAGNTMYGTTTRGGTTACACGVVYALTSQ